MKENFPYFLQILTHSRQNTFLSSFPFSWCFFCPLFSSSASSSTPENLFLFQFFCCFRFRINSNHKEKKKNPQVMSGLYNPNFSPARTASPQIRTSTDADRYSFFHSKLPYFEPDFINFSYPFDFFELIFWSMMWGFVL